MFTPYDNLTNFPKIFFVKSLAHEMSYNTCQSTVVISPQFISQKNVLISHKFSLDFPPMLQGQGSKKIQKSKYCNSFSLVRGWGHLLLHLWHSKLRKLKLNLLRYQWDTLYKDHYKPFQKDHYKPRTSLTVQAVYEHLQVYTM